MFDFNIGLDNFSNGDTNVAFVCAMGIITVFVGLICLIFVCKLLGMLVKGNSEQPQAQAAPIVAPAPVCEQPIENKQELLAAISAAVAEELGTDINGIRILSFKKL